MPFVSYCFWHPLTAYIFETNWQISMGFSANSKVAVKMVQLKKMKTEFHRLQTDFAWSHHILKSWYFMGGGGWLLSTRLEDVPQTFVPKSASWYINDPLFYLKKLVYEWVIFQYFPKFELKVKEIWKKLGYFGQKLAQIWVDGIWICKFSLTRQFSNHVSRLLSRSHTFAIIVILNLKIHQSMWIHWPFFPKTWTKGHDP